jgi:hypothetical protein
VSSFLAIAVTKFTERILGQFQAKKLCVVIDGLFLPMAIKEYSLSEDVVMAMAVHFIRLEQEVIFAPYLASAQLEALKNVGHLQLIYRNHPIRIPADFVLWNDSDQGPRQPNIYKHVLNLINVAGPGYNIAVLSPLEQITSSAATDCYNKFIREFSSVDLPQGNPILFFLQFGGIISPRLSRALAYRVVENDNVDRNDETQKALYEFMSVLLPLRAQIVHQLLANLEDQPPIINLKWDENDFNTTPPIIKLDNWRISDRIRDGNGPQGKKHSNFLEGWGITDVLAYETCAVPGPEEVDIYTLVPTVILRSLDLMGYFTHAQDEEYPGQLNVDTSTCSIYGQALKQFNTNPQLGEAAVLFIELVRTNAFTTFRNLVVPSSSAEDKDDVVNASQEKVAEDIALKIACLIPCTAVIDPAKTSGRYNIAPHVSFIKAAQAHARSLRMLLEASAGNIVLREMINASQPYARLRDPAKALVNNTDVTTTLPAALPFATAPPSARNFFMFCALREFKTAEAIAEHFGIPLSVVEIDVANIMHFVNCALKARTDLSVRDDDVGLDPSTLEVIEPALQYLCDVVGIEYTPNQVLLEMLEEQRQMMESEENY